MAEATVHVTCDPLTKPWQAASLGGDYPGFNEYEDDLKDVVLDDRTARSYRLDGGFDNFARGPVNEGESFGRGRRGDSFLDDDDLMIDDGIDEDDLE
ncbi:MAG: hypothetical protein F6K32_27830 [Desertifilum sp. SIO1I2]|nr:hypothetical protein [Desertifilum sp. SIO1I2]